MCTYHFFCCHHSLQLLHVQLLHAVFRRCRTPRRTTFLLIPVFSKLDSCPQVRTITICTPGPKVLNFCPPGTKLVTNELALTLGTTYALIYVRI